MGAIAPTVAATVDLAGDRRVERPSVRPIARADSPRAIPREISSRSARVRQRSGRRQDLGRIPPSLFEVLTHRPLRQPKPPADLGLAHPLRSQHPDAHRPLSGGGSWARKAALDPPVAPHLLIATSGPADSMRTWVIRDRARGCALAAQGSEVRGGGSVPATGRKQVGTQANLAGAPPGGRRA